jgi:malate/lactate dehydrogenase
VFSTGTLLDTSRLRYLIAERTGISQSNVHAYVVGEHGDSEFPLWSSATIANVPIRDWRVGGERIFSDQVLDEVSASVTQAAYRVIEGKGATNYAIGLSSSYLVESLLSTQRSVMPLSSVLDNYYGVSGIALSVPSLVSNEGLIQPVSVPMSATEIQNLHRSAATMRETLATIGYQA